MKKLDPLGHKDQYESEEERIKGFWQMLIVFFCIIAAIVVIWILAGGMK